MKVAELDELFFLKENIVDVNTASIGTSASRWEDINDKATEEEALKIMNKKRFDVLPIKSSNSLVKEYFRTKKWNDYSTLPERKTITHKDFIPLKTHIRDVIKGFASESERRFFYFLSHENRIAGLVTIADLNHRRVRIYLFSLLSELEMLLSNFIREKVSEGELLSMNYGNKKDEEIKNRYNKDKDNGVEVPFVEYLFMSDLINIAIKKDLHSKLGYSRTRFEGDFGSFNDLRNNVAHPNRSIVADEDSVAKLWERIDRIEEALFKLRHLDQKEE